ncbi:alpha/beta fold hydrolase [Kutzneria kofuensis]|uniref:Pimeloyl-ACP methyl ester carboxylesterase n=1 Tax=Kutzneria kofuensis TaxID=103725 RepID=A0A7W9NKE3_9PSEU|nr:alpha/beta hydrolase [Kutzneria kofuensis]MBB5896542.1 pimeloyl-ACP methyl ester carboxylesterase [Kutzneria kofuensis]
MDTATLSIAYEEYPGDGPAIVLVHGWPDGPRGWRRVAETLAAAGRRVLVPAIRGFGGTRFRDPATPRSGQLAALGRDLLEFCQALGLDAPVLIGHDWGARAAANACGLNPSAVAGLGLLSVGYGTNDPTQPIGLEQARNYWYHWYLASDRGPAELRERRVEFTRFMWETWSPSGWFDEAEFAATAADFANDDWADVVLHSYRHRWGFVAGDTRYDEDERRLLPAPVLAQPTLVLHGAADRCNDPATSAGKESFFTGRYQRVLLDGVGHFPQREAPDAVARHILEFFPSHSAPAR